MDILPSADHASPALASMKRKRAKLEKEVELLKKEMPILR